jgi:hypothetical protein
MLSHLLKKHTVRAYQICLNEIAELYNYPVVTAEIIKYKQLPPRQMSQCNRDGPKRITIIWNYS